MLSTVMPLSSVWRRAPLLASQISTVASCDADATCLPSGEKATEETELLWPSSVWRRGPLLASQILTVASCDADATCLPSGEKATEETELLWPSSVCRQGLQSSSVAGLVVIHSGSSFLNVSLMILRAGLNTS